MQQASEARRSQRRTPWALRAKSRKVVPWVCLMVPRPSCHLSSATTATSLLAQSVQRYRALVFSRQYNSR